MKFRHELRYDAPPASVLAMRLDPAYRALLAEAAGVDDSTTRIARDGETTTVVIEQERPTQGVPGFARKFVGDFTHTVIRESWTGTAGTFEVETPGKPMHVAGSVSAAPQGEGTVVVFDLEAAASVPLIGGRLERLTAELTSEGLSLEQELGERWLAEHP